MCGHEEVTRPAAIRSSGACRTCSTRGDLAPISVSPGGGDGDGGSRDLTPVFGPYIYFPIIAALTWLGGLLALIGLWAAAGKPRYRDNMASIVFVSHVAGKYKVSLGFGC